MTQLRTPRGAEETPPASSASVNARHGCTMREFLGTGQEEGGSRQSVGFAIPDRVDTVECRGRGATVGNTSSRVGVPSVSSCCSRQVRRGAEVACSCLQTDPNPKRMSSGRFRSTMRRGDARVDPRPTEGFASGHRRSGEDITTLCRQQHKSNRSSKNSLQRCHLERGELIHHRCLMTGVGEAGNRGPGRESRRRRRVTTQHRVASSSEFERRGCFRHNTVGSQRKCRHLFR